MGSRASTEHRSWFRNRQRFAPTPSSCGRATRSSPRLASVPRPELSASERFVRNAVAHLRTWKRGERRAPHKPLLLLYALARIQEGAPRLVDFVEAEPVLASLLDRFGPSPGKTH